VDLVLREDEASAYADPTVDKYTTVSPTGAITPGEQGIPAPRSLTATGVLGGIDLIWVNPLPLSQWSTIEVWESPENQWANAVLVAEVATDTSRREWAGGTQRWYWVRAKNEFGVVSDRFPDSDVSTVEATAVDPAGASGTYGTIEASNGVGWHQNTSGVWSPPGLTTDLSVTFQRSATALASAIVTVTNDGNGLLTGAITTPDADITIAFVGQGTSGLTTSFTYTPDNVTVSQFVQSGADGQDGAGSDANLIQLTYTAQTFSYDNSSGTPVLIGPSDIDFFLNKQNVADPTTWNVFDSTGADLGDAPLSSVTDTSAILTAASFGAITNNSEVEVVATAGIYQDRTTIVELLSGTDGLDGDNGEDATSGYLTNEAHTVPTDPDGSNPILDDAKGLFKFFVGITDVTNGAAFSIVNSAGGTFRINVGVNNPVAGQPRGYYDMTSMTQNNAVATFRATFGGVSIDKDFTVAKSIAGQVGDPGPTGDDGKPGTPGVSVVLPYNNNETTVNVAGEYGFKTSGGTRIDSWAILTDPAGVLDNIEIYKFDQNGVDHSAYLESIQVGTTLTWYDSRRRWLEYRTQTAVDAGAFMRYDLALVEFDEADGNQDIPTGIDPIELWFSQGLKGEDGAPGVGGQTIRDFNIPATTDTLPINAWVEITNRVVCNVGPNGVLDLIASGSLSYTGSDPVITSTDNQLLREPVGGGTPTLVVNDILIVVDLNNTISVQSKLNLQLSDPLPGTETSYEYYIRAKNTAGGTPTFNPGTSQIKLQWRS
jgi:hypothetical protein